MTKAEFSQARLWFYAILFGAISLFSVIKNLFKKGYGKMFNKIKRERPQCLQDENLGKHGYLHLEDVRIHYVAKGEEGKPLMLFLHGFPEFWYSWRYQLPEFSKDYRCVAIDMRGFGESDKPSGFANYQTQCLVKDIRQVIEALGYKSCILVGHDLGGCFSLSFAKQFPDYVDKLIVLNCHARIVYDKLLETGKKQFKMSWYVFFFQLPYLPEFISSLNDYHIIKFVCNKLYVNPVSAEDTEAYKYTYSQPGAFTAPINYYRAAMRMPVDRHDLDYKMPVLLIWGMRDKALSDEIPTLMEKMGPSITVKKIQDCGHFTQTDAPKEVNTIMREWMSSH